MPKSLTSIILSVIFMMFLVAPTVISIIDDSVDISVFYTSSEEEEKGIDKNKDVEVLVYHLNTIESCFFSNEQESHTGYFFKNYPKPHLNLISPPPEFI
ncbi:hypothetical protein MBM09_01105 [Flaviramulus sp. BrNp1-15]|uniref:hypothetical protein n=1 Tax=Flaviramulus sp. BrNp1-15 TaxID=2916754 RepID=UPI001EE8E7A7|nr:hypothetical protein [Flaviramulus sp. BrNp1-15]ULC59589.1 hypothetical protein MBM09_01105 [Flaviramulus sp. BrNp1-15]